MSSLLFTIAHTAPNVTPIIKLRYATQGDVRKIMSDTKMEFAPGLSEVLMSDSPPTLYFIKNPPMPLPSEQKDVWADYAILLESKDPRKKPLFYVCETCPQAGGITHRMNTYIRNYKQRQPVIFYAARLASYEISHIGLFAWCPSRLHLDVAMVPQTQSHKRCS